MAIRGSFVVPLAMVGLLRCSAIQSRDHNQRIQTRLRGISWQRGPALYRSCSACWKHCRGNLDQRNLVVGQPLQGSIERATGAVEVQVRRPDGTTNRFTVPPPDSGERQTWSYSITEHAGIYELERMDKSPAIHPSQWR